MVIQQIQQVVTMIDRYCRACGKRISLAEDDLYAGHCSICVTRRLEFIW